MRHVAFAVAVLATDPAQAEAQTVLQRFFAEQQFGHYGDDVAPAGDLDFDGHPDYIVSAPGRDWVDARSGFDGHVIHHITSEDGTTNTAFGRWIAGEGDVNGDDVPDIAISKRFGTPVSSILVYSGADASLLLTIDPPGSMSGQSPNALSFVGDVDDDGADDLLFGLDTFGVLANDSGQVWLFSGADGSVLYTDEGEVDFDHLGYTVAGLGDVNGDARPDFAYVKRYAGPAHALAVGLLRVVSGATLQVLWERTGPELGIFVSALGWSIAGVSDTDGDGVPDVAVASPNTLLMLSGLDGSVRWSVDAGGSLESPVAGGADVDGDGHPDVIIGNTNGDPGNQGWAKVYSGWDGERLELMLGPDRTTPEFGDAVALLGDVNGDGYGEILVGGPDQEHFSAPLFGAVTMFAGNPSPFGLLGGGVGGALGIPTLGATGMPKPQQDIVITLSGAPANSLALMIVSDEPSSVPLKGGTLVPGPEFVFGPFSTGPSGAVSGAARWPEQAIPGFTLWFQAWIVDPSAPQGVAASNALTATTP